VRRPRILILKLGPDAVPGDVAVAFLLGGAAGVRFAVPVDVDTA